MFGLLVCCSLESTWNYESYRQPVELLEQMIIPFARPVSKQNNKQRDETLTDSHAWSGIQILKPGVSAAKTFYALYCTTNLIGH
jgi:hypothetical protein